VAVPKSVKRPKVAKKVKKPIAKKKVKVKVVKKPIIKKSRKDEPFEVGFEEVEIRCPSCGRKFRVVKSAKFDTEGMLCQRCASGVGRLGFDEDFD
jgi:CRISPR/Cas system-associated protein Cas10 (large subunit of type III CRISPR-Cas system)